MTSRVSERRRASFTFKYEIHNEKRELVASRPHSPRVLGPGHAAMIALPDWLKEIMPDADLDPVAVRS